MKNEFSVELEKEELIFEEPEIEIIEYIGSDILTTSTPIIDEDDEGESEFPILPMPGTDGDDVQGEGDVPEAKDGPHDTGSEWEYD